MTSPISLHPRLEQDTIALARSDLGELRLMKKSVVPWLILIPNTACTELHELDESLYHQIMAQVQDLSSRLKQVFNADKINVAAIGNAVPQLHLHMVCRYQTDPAWPGVIWGWPVSEGSTIDVNSIQERIRPHLPDTFTPS